MNQTQSQKILDAIKLDSLILFSDLIKNKENLSLGRFPLLSLCYLYNAKKIINVYENSFIKIKNYDKLPECYEIYQKFKVIANRALRLYLDNDSIVSPIEMLALLHKDNKAKKLYRIYNIYNTPSKQIKDNLLSIYTISKQNPQIEHNTIKISRYPMSKHTKKIIALCTASTLACIFIISAIITFASITIGFGTLSSPYRINNSKQLFKAFNSKSHYIITRDINIDSIENGLNVQSYINGNNHTLHINQILNNALINTNNGSISNLNITYPNIEKTTSTSISLLTKDNNGTLENISISAPLINLTCNKNTEDILISGFATNNSGQINNCTLSINIDIQTEGSGECSFGGIVAKNSGKLENCILLKNSVILAKDADPAGICTTNNSDGKISNCKNYANITQNSDINEWSPNVAGITLSNMGTIENCINNGDLTAISTNTNESASGNIFIGGIAAINYNYIYKGLNNGKITATAEKLIIYAGGITAYSQYQTTNQTTIYPLLEKCGTTSEINTQSTEEKAFIFAGGLSGYIYGTIKDCYSLSTFSNSFNEDKNFIGSCIGSCSIQYSIFGSISCLIEANNNYILSMLEKDYQIGALIYGNSIVQAGSNLNSGIITKSDPAQIKNQSIYWE